ncbi:MAG: hypothetical protein NC548_05495 [Lachnospiraceae bacterium]|nr:hypothetical protein [Lachnospiraceae bacterium]
MEDYIFLPVSGIAIVEPLMSSVHRLPDDRVYSSCHKQSQNNNPVA